ncbi:MAG: Hint domain-containing protein [Pseudomonadota bacterium]
MAVFNFSLPIYGFDQWSGSASTNNTVSYTNGTSFTLNDPATLTTIDVADDDGNPAGSSDNFFSDGFIDTPGDGSTASTANNDQVLTQPVTINGNDYDVGDQVELEFAFTTTSGDTFWVIRIDGVNVGISGATLPTPGTQYTVSGSADGSETPIDDIPCFTDGALVETPTGPRLIETLKPGDLVTTVDHGAQPILWTGRRAPSARQLHLLPKLRPIMIRANALGHGLPKVDTVLSPQHRVVVSSADIELYFGVKEAFATAQSLINGRTIYRDGRAEPVYRHLLLARHEVLIVNGMKSESLYPGTRHLGPEQLMELDLQGIVEDDTRLARPMLRHFEAALLDKAA